jgi:hypothetical protein
MLAWRGNTTPAESLLARLVDPVLEQKRLKA